MFDKDQFDPFSIDSEKHTELKLESELIDKLHLYGLDGLVNRVVKIIAKHKVVDDINFSSTCLLVDQLEDDDRSGLKVKCFDFLKTKKLQPADLVNLFKDYLGNTIQEKQLFFDVLTRTSCEALTKPTSFGISGVTVDSTRLKFK